MKSDPDQHYDFIFLRLKEGDEYAFKKIFNSKFNQVVGFCNSFLNNSEDAKNIAQEAFINLWVNRAKIERISGIDSFLFTHAKSACLNNIRHRGVVNRYVDHILDQKEVMLNIQVLESIDFYSVECAELENIIRKSIENLPEQCRNVFILKRFDGKKNSDVAVELGITIKAVEANMTRALKLLKEQLSDYLPSILIVIALHYFYG